MPQSLGIEALIEKLETLMAEKKAAIEQFDNQIKELESCIELLSGKPYTEYMADFRFDDENPNYIKSSQEEM